MQGQELYYMKSISIHALLAESDNKFENGRNGQNIISIHALLAESDQYHIFEDTSGATFLSTLSLRRATYHGRYSLRHSAHFYPRSPCGERLACRGWLEVIYYFYPRSPCGERQYPEAEPCEAPTISIHALLAESDVSPDTSSTQCKLFLSTLSLRRATSDLVIASDIVQFLSTLSLRRATNCYIIFAQSVTFLSTLSLRRATLEVLYADGPTMISIHALLAESDRRT